MKTTSIDHLKWVDLLFHTIEMRKQNEKQEKLLKAQIRALMTDELILEAGEYVVIVRNKSRTSLDTDKLKEDLGLDLVKKYTSQLIYETLEVHPIFGEVQTQLPTPELDALNNIVTGTLEILRFNKKR